MSKWVREEGREREEEGKEASGKWEREKKGGE